MSFKPELAIGVRVRTSAGMYGTIESILESGFGSVTYRYMYDVRLGTNRKNLYYGIGLEAIDG